MKTKRGKEKTSIAHRQARLSAMMHLEVVRGVAQGWAHLDLKKLGSIPGGGAKRFARGFLGNGAGYSPPGKRGHDFIHVAVDDHSRYADMDAIPGKHKETNVGFFRPMTEAFIETIQRE